MGDLPLRSIGRNAFDVDGVRGVRGNRQDVRVEGAGEVIREVFE